MNETIPGFNKYQNGMLEKIIEPLNEYALCALKIKQLRGNKNPNVSTSNLISRTLGAMSESKNRIYEILSKEQSEL
jgi:hypothetical protein